MRTDSKRGRGKGKATISGNGSNAGIAAGNGTPTTGVSDVRIQGRDVVKT